MTISDTLSLYEWNLNHFVANILNRDDYLNGSLLAFRLFTYMQYWSLEIDRLLFIKSRHYNVKWSKPRYALLLSSLVVTFFILFNVPILFTYGQSFYLNQTLALSDSNQTNDNGDLNVQVYTESCYWSPDESSSSLEWVKKWDMVSSTLYAYAPCCLIVLINLLLIAFLSEKQRKKSRLLKQQQHNSNRYCSSPV